MTIGASAGFFMGRVTNPGAGSPVSLALEGKGNEAFHALAMNYLGIDTWSPRDNTFKNIISRCTGLKALIIGVGISLLASKLGVNRRLGQAKLPYIRI